LTGNHNENTNLQNIVLVFVIFLSTSAINASAQKQFYRVKLIRASPDNLLEVVEMLKNDRKKHAEYGIEKPYLMRQRFA